MPRQAGIPLEFETELFNVLQAKDICGLNSLCAGLNKNVDMRARKALLMLPELYGDSKILALARKFLPDYPEIRTALEELEVVGEELKSVVDTLAFDLADLRGYHYHSGMVEIEMNFAYAGNCQRLQHEALNFQIAFQAAMTIKLGTDLKRFASSGQSRWQGMQYAARITKAGNALTVQ